MTARSLLPAQIREAQEADRAWATALTNQLRADRVFGLMARGWDPAGLRPFCVDENILRRCLKVAAVPEDRFEEYVRASIRKARRILLKLAIQEGGWAA